MASDTAVAASVVAWAVAVAAVLEVEWVAGAMGARLAVGHPIAAVEQQYCCCASAQDVAQLMAPVVQT